MFLIIIPVYDIDIIIGCVNMVFLLPTGSEERGVLGVGSIPVAMLPSRQDMKYIAL